MENQLLERAREIAPSAPPDVRSHRFIDLLRFNTCGSVDDGKSTLIGRLLYDSKSLMDDQLKVLERSAAFSGGGTINLASLTDGLRAEREQGITIDVAYRYFATPRRKFIVADTPGHIQYTRNMVSGASTSDLSVILVDARTGVVEQTRRHAALASLLRIPRLVVAVNKMDLVGWSQERFEEIRHQVEQLLPRLQIANVQYIPLSALSGDNVVEASARSAWFEGPPLLRHLETVDVDSDATEGGLRFPVQWVNRPREPTDARLHDFRGFAGQLAGGSVRVGQKVMVLPAEAITTVKEIHTYDGSLAEAFSPQSVTLVLADALDISRGDTIVGLDGPRPLMDCELEANLCWLHTRPLECGRRYLLKHSTQTVQASVTELQHRLDIETLEAQAAPGALGLNDIGQVRLRTAKPLVYDHNRQTGSFILIDPGTNATIAAGMLRPPVG